MTFKSTSGLKKHNYRKHSTKEAKTCELCGKRFPDTFAVTRHHQIIHLGLKPYECKYCEESFSGSSNLTILASIQQISRWKLKIIPREIF